MEDEQEDSFTPKYGFAYLYSLGVCVRVSENFETSRFDQTRKRKIEMIQTDVDNPFTCRKNETNYQLILVRFYQLIT